MVGAQRDAQPARTGRHAGRTHRGRVDAAFLEFARKRERRLLAAEHDRHDRTGLTAHVVAEIAEFVAHARGEVVQPRAQRVALGAAHDLQRALSGGGQRRRGRRVEDERPGAAGQQLDDLGRSGHEAARPAQRFRERADDDDARVAQRRREAAARASADAERVRLVDQQHVAGAQSRRERRQGRGRTVHPERRLGHEQRRARIGVAVRQHRVRYDMPLELGQPQTVDDARVDQFVGIRDADARRERGDRADRREVARREQPRALAAGPVRQRIFERGVFGSGSAEEPRAAAAGAFRRAQRGHDPRVGAEPEVIVRCEVDRAGRERRARDAPAAERFEQRQLRANAIEVRHAAPSSTPASAATNAAISARVEHSGGTS